MSDPTIEQIEAELNQSRFAPWDVETFLANRHQAKIEALTAPEAVSPLVRWWTVGREMFNAFAWFVGTMTIISGLSVWLLTGVLYLPPFSYGQ